MVIDKSVKEIRKIKDTEEATRKGIKATRIPFGVETLRSAYGNKDIDLTPSQVIQCLCHLSPDIMANAIAASNRGQTQSFKITEIETIDIPHITEPVKPVTHEFQSGDCCPVCGSINYFQSGTCKTCHDCSFAGGCG